MPFRSVLPIVRSVLASMTYMFFVAAAVWPAPGYAAEAPEAEAIDANEHAKINTLDASPVDPGSAEFEVSYGYAHSQHLWDDNGSVHGRGLSREHAMSFTLTAGVVDNLDVAFGGSYKWLKDKENDFDADDDETGPETGHGFGDLDVAAKYRFWEDKERSFQMAYVGGFTIPTGRRADFHEMGTSQEYWTFNQTLAGDKDWGKWTANFDAGFALPFGNRKGGARGSFSADVAGGYQVLPWLQPEVELNFSHDIISDAGDSQVLAITGGLGMPVHDNLRMSLGIQQGLWGRNADRSTSFVAAVTALV